MSKHKDYTRYSNREQRTETKLMEEVEAKVANTEFETVTAEAVVEEPETEQLVMEEVPEMIPEPKAGVVSGCARLNVRIEPDPNADVVCAINAGTKLVIYEDESTDEFYAICTHSGIEGYCVKKFITLLP